MPGTIHTDLRRAGLIPDPLRDRNDLTLAWIGRSDWLFGRGVAVDAPALATERVDLVCEGLDTVARLEVNGTVVGDAANMHHPHRFDVTGLLRQGDNRLAVRFESAVRHARDEERRLGTLPWLNTAEPFNFVRKMACNFGWDWAPELITCGIFEPVYFEAWSGARIAAVRPLVTRADPRRAVLEVHVDREGDADVQVDATLSFGGAVVARGAAAEGPAMLEVPSPSLWWPRGWGDQPLYELAVTLRRGGADLDRWTGRVGLRAVHLDTTEDEAGSRFVLEVNGRPIFCRGANFVPVDGLPDRALEPDRTRAVLEEAAAANMNTLRVWGGGLYGSDALYDACDELGLLVWQDFAFACACYPEEEPHRSRVEAEARHNVARLSRHPSLVLWNGCNENLWGYHDWGWRTAVQGRSWGAGYYFHLLARVCAELDPSRPYWPASPHSGAFDPDGEPHPNRPDLGNSHIWSEWHDGGHSTYGTVAPRFVSEHGFQGPPSRATLAELLPLPALDFDSALLAHHQRSERAERSAREMLKHYFGERSDLAFESEHHLRQLVQARALRMASEWLRSQAPVCAGTILWQLNDCWPAMSWSLLDSHGRRKLAWYAVRASYAPRLLTIQPASEVTPPAALYAINDTDSHWRAPVRVARRDFDGRVVAQVELILDVAPRASSNALVLPPELVRPANARAELLTASAAGVSRAVRFFAPDRELIYPKPDFDVRTDSAGDVERVHVHARTLVRELCLHADALEAGATVGDQLITLLPGEDAVMDVRWSVRPWPDVRPALTCTNGFAL